MISHTIAADFTGYQDWLKHRLSRLLCVSLLCLVNVGIGSRPAQAQSCDNIPSGGEQSLAAHITINGTQTEVFDGSVLPIYTQLRIDSIATASGSCTGMFIQPGETG